MSTRLALSAGACTACGGGGEGGGRVGTGEDFPASGGVGGAHDGAVGVARVRALRVAGLGHANRRLAHAAGCVKV